MIEVGQYYKGINDDGTTIVYKITKVQPNHFTIIIVRDDDTRTECELYRGRELDIPSCSLANWIVQAILLEGQELAWELI